MSPDSRSRARQSRPRGQATQQVRTGPTSDDAHDVVFFRRHHDDDADQAVPGRDFLSTCPTKVRATMRAVLIQVAAAPPKRFAGGGYWEAMKDKMTGWFEVRVDGPHRHHFRLFCNGRKIRQSAFPVPGAFLAAQRRSAAVAWPQCRRPRARRAAAGAHRRHSMTSQPPAAPHQHHQPPQPRLSVPSASPQRVSYAIDPLYRSRLRN
jgi:hypothetical protein